MDAAPGGENKMCRWEAAVKRLADICAPGKSIRRVLRLVIIA